MAANGSTLADEDGEFSDWIEVYNPTSEAIPLNGWALTDNAGNLQKWLFDDGSIPAGGYQIVFASGKDRTISSLAWETIIDWGDIWRYHVGDTEPPENWLAPDFLDASWNEGASGFGYGDDDDATEVPVVMSVFVRRAFSVDDAANIESALLHIDYDDAFVAYLNGVEIARANIGAPGIRPAFDASALAPIEPLIATGQAPVHFEIENLSELLIEGENVLAIEVHNASLSSSDLTLIPFLTLGYRSAPNPDGEVAPALLPLPGQENHTNFLLTKDGEYLALVAPNGTPTSTFDPAFPRQTEDISFGFRDGTAGYLASPSPGSPNSTLLSGFVSEPTFSVDHGFFDAPFNVTLASSTTSAMIRYTLDGSAPTPSSGLPYEGPIPIEGTSVLRAAAFKAGFIDSQVQTRSYLFLNDVVLQANSGSPPMGWPITWGGNVVDYGMDFAIVGNEGTASRMEILDALKAIPTLSIATELTHLFDADSGIYANANERGREWERPASAELIFHDGQEGFHINAGLRIRGGFSRNNDNPKHAFRLFFRDQTLKYPLFGNEGVDEFDNLDLRTSQNYSWSFNGDGRNTMNRDVFSRDVQRDMGMPYTRSRYYHLYLNGQYWGLYQSQERAEASYGASYFGGNKADFDVLKSTERADGFYDLEATDGNTETWISLWEMANQLADAGTQEEQTLLYNQLQGLNPDGTRNPAFPVMIDIDNLINYMLVIFYTGNFDGPISWFLGNEHINNFYVLTNRTGGEGFRFFAHDNEHTLLPDAGQAFDRTGPYPAGRTLQESNPQWIHQQLMASEEYRLRFADLANKHLANGGTLTPGASTNRFLNRATEIEKAIVAESARWGDAKRGQPFTVFDWQNALNTITDTFFPSRTEDILGLLKETRRYADWRNPAVGTHPFAPFTSSRSTRLQSARVAPFLPALISSCLAPLIRSTIPSMAPTPVSQAVPFLRPHSFMTAPQFPWTPERRLRHAPSRKASGQALGEATFYIDASVPDAATLVITEVHFNPSTPTPEEEDAGFTDNDDFEYLEIYNASTISLDLAGVAFTEGITFTFGDFMLAPAAHALVVRDGRGFCF